MVKQIEQNYKKCMKKENFKMEELIKVLSEVKEGVDFKNEKSLISDGILTSFDLITLIPVLNEKFDVNITAAELLPENFESAEDIKRLIDSLK